MICYGCALRCESNRPEVMVEIQECRDEVLASKEKVMDKSKLTIQRPEGCPEWADIGVLVMVKDREAQDGR